MQYYYESADHKLCGPVEEVEIRRLWTEGVLQDDSLITPLGMTSKRSYREMFLSRHHRAAPLPEVDNLRTALVFGGIDFCLGIIGFVGFLVLFIVFVLFQESMGATGVYPWVRLFYGMAVSPIYLIMGAGLWLRWKWWGRFLAVIYSVIEIKVQLLSILWVVIVLSFYRFDWGDFGMVLLVTASLLWSCIVIGYAAFQACLLSKPAVVSAFDVEDSRARQVG